MIHSQHPSSAEVASDNYKHGMPFIVVVCAAMCNINVMYALCNTHHVQIRVSSRSCLGKDIPDDRLPPRLLYVSS